MNIFETSILYLLQDDYMIHVYTEANTSNAARCKYLKIGVWDRFGEEKINSTDQLGPQGAPAPKGEDLQCVDVWGVQICLVC